MTRLRDNPADSGCTQVGGIVLCGGQSRRMGTAKPLLPFGDQTMLQRVVSIVSQATQPVVVVSAPTPPGPPLLRGGMQLPPDVLLAEDPEPGLGPLAGLSAGLAALRGQCTAAFATACDVPLLKPEVIQYLIESRGNSEIAVFRDDRFHHVLAAVYATALLPRIERLLAAGRRRLLDLLEASNTREIDVGELRQLDPAGDSLRNANTPEEYAALLRIAGLPGPAEGVLPTQ